MSQDWFNMMRGFESYPDGAYRLQLFRQDNCGLGIKSWSGSGVIPKGEKLLYLKVVRSFDRTEVDAIKDYIDGQDNSDDFQLFKSGLRIHVYKVPESPGYYVNWQIKGTANMRFVEPRNRSPDKIWLQSKSAIYGGQHLSIKYNSPDFKKIIEEEKKKQEAEDAAPAKIEMNKTMAERRAQKSAKKEKRKRK